MPQALRHVIPGLVNSFIALFKDTSLVSIVALFDLLGQLARLVRRSGLGDADDAVHRLCLHRNDLLRVLLWNVALFAVRRAPAERAPAQLSEITMTDNSIVSITGLNKWYGDFHVLRDINLDVAKGERIVICGPSGSGKSTLIRCINALEEFQEGEIVVDGIELGPNLRRVDEVRREVGMVFQSFNLFPHLTVLENCTLAPIWVRNIPKKDAEAAAMKYPGAGEDPASGQQISGPDVRRPAAARRDRARADHESEGHAVRRADLGARSRNGQGSARHHGRSRQGGHDHAGRHPRNGICPRSRQPHRLHGRRPDHRGQHAGRISSPIRSTRGRSCSSARSCGEFMRSVAERSERIQSD